MNLRVKLPKRVTAVLDVPRLPRKVLSSGQYEFTVE